MLWSGREVIAKQLEMRCGCFRAAADATHSCVDRMTDGELLEFASATTSLQAEFDHLLACKYMTGLHCFVSNTDFQHMISQGVEDVNNLRKCVKPIYILFHRKRLYVFDLRSVCFGYFFIFCQPWLLWVLYSGLKVIDLSEYIAMSATRTSWSGAVTVVGGSIAVGAFSCTAMCQG